MSEDLNRIKVVLVEKKQTSKWLVSREDGKSKELCNFLPYIPNDYERYVEPFAGGAALFFHLEPNCAIINDIKCSASVR